jgi:hypothetical protein
MTKSRSGRGTRESKPGTQVTADVRRYPPLQGKIHTVVVRSPWFWGGAAFFVAGLLAAFLVPAPLGLLLAVIGSVVYAAAAAGVLALARYQDAAKAQTAKSDNAEKIRALRARIKAAGLEVEEATVEVVEADEGRRLIIPRGRLIIIESEQRAQPREEPG